MKIVNLKSYQDLVADNPLILVLGYFDALHLGHKALFEEAKKLANHRQLKVAVLTFHESPKLAFMRFHPDLLCHLTAPEKRYAKFAEYGVDELYLLNFTSSLAQTSADDFIAHYIHGLNTQAIVVGFDYHFGHERADVNYLAQHSRADLVVVPEVQDSEDKISSTRIRQAISQGKIETANRLLGYPYSTRGIVVHGDARGRTMGFPTANLAPLDRTFLPTDGVYVADVIVGDQTYRAMASVGKNVTFDGQELRLEAHLFDFEGDIYGETLEILWLSKIRDMVKFTNMEALAQQLNQDKKIAKNWQKD